ncbi:hypothetical protein KRP22_013344 [Phytophthora ramorum]|nr:hypothetical protein KRP22_10864 [Phytophthora ramorum]
MDVILSRAGLSGAQQRSLCLGAVQDEARQTETKLADALASLKRLQEVVRVARCVHKVQAFAMLAPELQTCVARMNQSGKQISPLLEGILSGLNAFIVSRPHESSGSSIEEEGADSEWAVTWGSARQQSAPDRYPRENRLSSDAYSSDEGSAASFFSLRLSKLSSDEQEGAFGSSIKSALQVARLSQVKGKEELVQQGMESARAAIDDLINQQLSSPDSDEHPRHLEDLRQALSVVVRAILETDGKIEASGLRDLQARIKELQDTFPGSATRFKWCNIQLRKFLTAKYKRPTEISLADQNKLDLIVAQVREWRGLNDFSASRFGEIMTFVTETLGGSYEEWTPCEDPRFAELIGIMIIRVNAFRDSHVQETRLFEIHGWLYKMSGASFTPTLDLASVPPLQITEVYATVNQGFRSMDDVEDGFERLSQAKAKKHFGFLASTSYTFLATAVVTQNQRLLLPNQLQRFNENLQALKEFDVVSDPSTILQSYQDLEKVLYLMRVLMHRRPEYQESSVGTVDTLLALFPPSQRPTFAYPPGAASSAPKSIETGESVDVEANEDEA